MIPPVKSTGMVRLLGWLLLLVGASIFSWYLFPLQKPVAIRYPDFGISLPPNYRIHGIDVSHYQHAIDWTSVRAMNRQQVSIGFGFIKATEGADYMDENFYDNWREAKAAGMARGAYHFFNPRKGGREQAFNYISRVRLVKGDLPPVCDIERTDGVPPDVLQARLREWLQVIEAHYGVRPLIYTGAAFYRDYLSGAFDGYPLWVAHYQVANKPSTDRQWHFWQHNDAGHVDGIDTYVDFNVFNGDSAAFRQLLVK